MATSYTTAVGGRASFNGSERHCSSFLPDVVFHTFTVPEGEPVTRSWPSSLKRAVEYTCWRANVLSSVIFHRFLNPK